MCIASLFGPHLQLLEFGNTAVWIENNDFGSRHIRKSGHCGFSGVTGSCRKNHNTVLAMVFTGTRDHEARQNRQCHILESDGLSMKKFKKIGIVLLYQRSNAVCIELRIIRMCNTVPEFLLRKVRKEFLHDLIREILIRHTGKLRERFSERRQSLRHKKTAVCGKAF